ncbi:hypothetical protein HMF8227_02709 [Saliniradius amylolyticus]|uniref:Uncharacterized protein n=1 Tax=Saliniradius amylolyticus TaxID=2183582 RepID=A0A2S2E7F6_9ALTE|nr:outer membrane beta-barrel protein [Saliniradius amylolyticus]AWL13160.1 hypothetical protein HMF8227_02709 [Saliniradius amylolyticus]
MRRSILSVLLLISVSLNTAAADDWSLGGVYGQVSQAQTDFEVVMLSVSHPMQIENTQWMLTPEFRYGFGVDKEMTSLLVEAELEHISILSLKVQYHFGQGFVYAAPQFGRLEARNEGSGLTLDTEEFGWAIGGGWQVSQRIQLEGSIEQLDDNDLLTVSVRYQF